MRDKIKIKWSPLSREIRNRIKVAVAAYAYEIEDDPIISDHDFDKLVLRIRPKMRTGKKRLDRFFRKIFNTHTGQWIHSHPDLEGVRRIYERYYK